jgi:hypothetical protein
MWIEADMPLAPQQGVSSTVNKQETETMKKHNLFNPVNIWE